MIIGILLITMLFVSLLVVPQGAVFLVYINVIGNIFISALIWIGCRLIVHTLWKKFPWEKEPVKHLLIEIITIPLWAFIIMEISYEIYCRFNFIANSSSHVQGLAVGLLITLLITSIHEGVYFYMQWKQHFALSVKLEKDNLEARYETLKAQLNPHFLFNSLNTLITYVEDNPRATDYIQNLSDFMRYVLKNREKELVLLNEELEVCRRYLFLQQSRFGDNLRIDININEKYLMYCVPPLSVQMLIDNSIKHNVISKEKPLLIRMGIENTNYLFVSNNLQVKSSEAKNGLGIKNISDRYEFLSQQQIIVNETATEFKVSLPLLKANI